MDKADEVEVARCLLMSQTHCYKAWCEVIEIQKKLNRDRPGLMQSLHWLHQKKDITEGLEKYVEKAQYDGAINAKQAEAILHPLHEQISGCLKTIHEATDGIVRKELINEDPDGRKSQAFARQMSMESSRETFQIGGGEQQSRPLLKSQDEDQTTDGADEKLKNSIPIPNTDEIEVSQEGSSADTVSPAGKKSEMKNGKATKAKKFKSKAEKDKEKVEKAATKADLIGKPKDANTNAASDIKKQVTGDLNK